MMQDKIIAAIVKIASDHKLEAVESWDCSNVGTIYFQQPDGFETLFRCHVDFQPTYLKATIYKGADREPVPGGRFHCEYQAPGVVQKFLTQINVRAIHAQSLVDQGLTGRGAA